MSYYIYICGLIFYGSDFFLVLAVHRYYSLKNIHILVIIAELYSTKHQLLTVFPVDSACNYKTEKLVFYLVLQQIHRYSTVKLINFAHLIQS